MSKQGKIIIVASGIFLTTGILLFIFGQDKRRKKAYSTPVPPEYARDMIKHILSK